MISRSTVALNDPRPVCPSHSHPATPHTPPARVTGTLRSHLYNITKEIVPRAGGSTVGFGFGASEAGFGFGGGAGEGALFGAAGLACGVANGNTTGCCGCCGAGGGEGALCGTKGAQPCCVCGSTTGWLLLLLLSEQQLWVEALGECLAVRSILAVDEPHAGGELDEGLPRSEARALAGLRRCARALAGGCGSVGDLGGRGEAWAGGGRRDRRTHALFDGYVAEGASLPYYVVER